MNEKPSLETKKNIQVVYGFAIPSGDFYNALCDKEGAISALMYEYKPLCVNRPFGKEILCYETEQQCLGAYNAFHKLIPSATYIGRGEVHES